MESFFNTSFADVRIHVGQEAPSIGALAFTHGTDLYFAPGQYNPQSPHGQKLLGHELSHVVQQRAGRVRNPLGSNIAVVQDPALEAEAERMGAQAATTAHLIQAKPAPNHLASSVPNRPVAGNLPVTATPRPASASSPAKLPDRGPSRPILQLKPVYRAMLRNDDDGGNPQTGSAGARLGVRPRHLRNVWDVNTTSNSSIINPGTGGMSVGPGPAPQDGVPAYKLPAKWGGTDNSYEIYTVETDNLPATLSYREDQPGVHGLIEPRNAMTCTALLAALRATKASWTIVEP